MAWFSDLGTLTDPKVVGSIPNGHLVTYFEHIAHLKSS